MSSENNPSEQHTTPDNWQVVEELQNTLARYLREHEAGRSHNPREILEWAREEIRRLLAAPIEDVVDVSVRDLLASYWEQVSRRSNVASTGFSGLNDVLSGGIEDSRLVIMLGAPNTGKTTFAHQMADHIADSGRPVLDVTSEDSPATLMAKTLARIGGLNYTAVLKGWESERMRINAALARQIDRISSDRLHYLDVTNGVDAMDVIREKAAAHFSRYSDASQGGTRCAGGGLLTAHCSGN